MATTAAASPKPDGAVPLTRVKAFDRDLVGEAKHPFKYDYAQCSGALQFLKMVVVGLILFPLRLTVFIVFFLILWLSSLLSSCCSSGASMPRAQFVSRFFMRLSSRMVLWALGYWWITVNGKHDPKARLVVANHCSFADAFYFAYAMLPMAVAKAELLHIPLVGTIARAQQTITVSRESAKNRTDVQAEICRRTRWHVDQPEDVLKKHGDWPQLLIFPEATCTNTTSVIEFKLGAFTPLVPVQPVALDFRQRHLDVSWVGSCPLPLTIVRMMCQVYNKLDVTYLDTIDPDAIVIPARYEGGDEEERTKARIKAFAESARVAIAAALKIPTTNHNFLDVLLLREVRLLRLPTDKINVQMGNFPSGLAAAKEKLKEFAALDSSKTGLLGPAEFAKLLGFENDDDAHREHNERIAEAVISLYDKDGDGKINFTEFLLFSAWRQLRRVAFARSNSGQLIETESESGGLTRQDTLSDTPSNREDEELKLAFALAFGAFDHDHDSRVSCAEFISGVARIAPSIPNETLTTLFADIDADRDGVVTLDEYMAFCQEHPYLMLSVLDALNKPTEDVAASASSEPFVR